jgi:hypothetical protein
MIKVDTFSWPLDNSKRTPIPKTTKEKNHNPFNFVISFNVSPPF